MYFMSVLLSHFAAFQKPHLILLHRRRFDVILKDVTWVEQRHRM
jgi:hypothetical protein